MIEESRPLGSGSLLVLPTAPVAAVLLLSGSSGRLEEGRARLLARHGAATLAWQWFGSPGQPAGICEIPLKSFSPALDLLVGLHPQLVVLGVSKGAEAALLLAALDPRIRMVAGLAPSSVVWANVGPGVDGAERPQRSSFSADGVGLPFVPYDDDWRQPSGVPAFRGLYEQSLTVFADRLAAAAIPVEQIAGEVVLTAGGDDQVWPSALFARRIEARRQRAGLRTLVLHEAGAGHRLLLPGESPPTDGRVMARGGSEQADRALGAELWAVLADRLSLST